MGDEKDEMYLCVDYPWRDFDDATGGISGVITRHMNKLHGEGYKPFSIKEFPLRSRFDKLINYEDQVIHTEHSMGNGDCFEHVRWTRIYYQRM
jgi:hypothetical protein|tara:strand:- start:614 stop:892 length:279 start_codon:yes stop_codon:yes gene_type:complete